MRAIPDPFSETSIYIAESAGCIRRVDIQTKDTKTVYRGPTAPVTSVAVGGHGGSTIFGGCWDKNIWSWDRESGSVGRKYKGHSDFVKAVLCCEISGKHLLISGGADSKIIVWDIETCDRLHTLRDNSDNMMALQDLVIDLEESNDNEIVLISSSSDPHIRRWRISLSIASQIIDTIDEGAEAQSRTMRDTILEHETSVYQVLFSGEDENSDLWTASADGTAKCLSRARNWSAEEIYAHGDYVRAIVVTSDWAITAGRDEDVKIWNRSTGKLWHIYDGHYEEVTGLVLRNSGKSVVSVSIDGTVRTWGLEKAVLNKAIEERMDRIKGVVKEEKAKPKKGLLTAEEEAELAELMDSGEE